MRANSITSRGVWPYGSPEWCVFNDIVQRCDNELALPPFTAVPKRLTRSELHHKIQREELHGPVSPAPAKGDARFDVLADDPRVGAFCEAFLNTGADWNPKIAKACSAGLRAYHFAVTGEYPKRPDALLASAVVTNAGGERDGEPVAWRDICCEALGALRVLEGCARTLNIDDIKYVARIIQRGFDAPPASPPAADKERIRELETLLKDGVDRFDLDDWRYRVRTALAGGRADG